MPDIVNVYIPAADSFMVPCPHCGRSTEFPVPASPDAVSRTFEFTCRCGRELQVRMNFRRAIRRAVALVGAITFSSLGQTQACAVDDISLRGLRLSVYPTPGVTTGEEVTVKLVLDDPRKSKLALPGVVTRVEQKGPRLVLGIEFGRLPPWEAEALSYYFM